jgi:hypothetical protein
MEFNELSLKLKAKVVYMLTHNPQNLDKEYLIRKEKVYTRRELAAEIEAETELGIIILTDMIMLAIDISSRHRV